MTNYTFITGNPYKVAEAERILGFKLRHHALDLAEIQEVSIEAVVQDKVAAAYRHLRCPVIIEDTGLSITAWNGLPGALTKWFLQRLGLSGICELLNASSNRQAIASTIVVAFDGQSEPLICPGMINGSIAEAPMGDTGFGWDPIFIPEGSSRTFAQMSSEEKDCFSMRRLAFEALAARIGTL